ncbi:monocarboxylate transporter 12-B-like [Ylistrum balloti]|uniref:monocarboxylate transporter 12-B-like n=1 Tax=Ylistrum balloti TaxID=509963 RepID=UPI0029059FDB|nr:monocarboxylate transporter 12-B-like [Ylistrum balloti]
MFLVYGGILGMFTGIFGALLSVVTVDIVGKANLNMAFGTLSFFHGITFTLGTPIAGWIADESGGYEEGLYFAAVVFATGSLISFCIYIRQSRHARSLKSLVIQRSIQNGIRLKSEKSRPFVSSMAINFRKGMIRRLSVLSENIGNALP